MDWNKQQVSRAVDAEGMDYFLLHYLDVEKITDDDLRAAAIEAKTALQKFESLLEEVE